MGAKTSTKTQRDASRDRRIEKEGYERAVGLLTAASTTHGFVASLKSDANYRRIWGRDSTVTGLAALLTGDPMLIRTFKASLCTLAENQGPHGEIPSNVDPQSHRVSYGSTAGRVDADLWFCIGCIEYWKATGDDEFLDEMMPALQKVRFLLGAWEFNNRGLLYIPQTGDWADEYIHNGYVLYDQLLYYQVQRSLLEAHEGVHSSADHEFAQRVSRLKHMIQDNYWLFRNDGEAPEDVYHEVLYKKGRKAAQQRAGEFWMPFFAPYGYGYRFDALANVLVSLLDLASDEQREMVDSYILDETVPDKCHLLPAFYPVITPKDSDWSELQVGFSNTFRNQPHEYQNGGLWPMITGFYVADLAQRGLRDQARAFLLGIHRANALELDGEPWSFPEYVDGEKFTAGGTPQMAWSAAAAIIGHHALHGEHVFRVGS